MTAGGEGTSRSRSQVRGRPGLASSSRRISANSSSSSPRKSSATTTDSIRRLRVRGHMRRTAHQSIVAPQEGAAAFTKRAGAPTTVAPSGTSSTTTALAPTTAPAPMCTARSPSAPRADAHARPHSRALGVAGAQADRHPGRTTVPGWISTHVDHELAVRDVDARMHHDRVADGHLGRTPSRAGARCGQDRDPERPGGVP